MLGLLVSMFSQIKGVVDILTSGFKTVRDFKSESDRELAILNMLRFYFVLKDSVDDGEALIVEAGSNPTAKLAALPPAAASEMAASWDRTLRLQAMRLRALQGMLSAQDALAVINPELQTKIDKAVGYKMNRAVTLHGIGSALVIRCMFPLNESPAKMASLVATMAGERRDKINLDRIRREVADLRASLDEYREHIKALATNNEIVKLSKKARRDTQSPKEA